MSFRHYICVLLLLLAAPMSAQQAVPAPPVEASVGYTVFLRGQAIGREQVSIGHDASGATIIVSQSRLGPPLNLVTRRAEVRYRADGTAESVTIDAQLNGAEFNFKTTFADGKANTTGVDAGAAFSSSDAAAADTIALPNLLFGVYEALGRRLQTAAAGTEVRAYIVPHAEVVVRLANVTTQRLQSGMTTFTVRRLELLFLQPRPALDIAVTLTVDERGGLVSLNIPADTLDVVRDDMSSPTSRTMLYSNPGDEAATIPAAGFNLGATLTRPSGAAPGTRFPAVILLAGSDAADRDGMTLGVPTIGELAGALADAGFLAVRYDRRGSGQSGGRSESVTLEDFAQDARAAFAWLRNRRDIDPRRIAVLGHGDGAWVAILAAVRERRFAGIVSIAASSMTGAELVLEQQRSALDLLNTPDAERTGKVSLQRQINAAVVSGRGWEGISADVRRQADTPWFQSLLAFDPARIVSDARQPMLFVHGEVDRQVPVAHAERLASVARAESRSKSIAVVTFRGVNHLLIPAVTGDISEYPSLTDRHVSRDVSSAVTTWLTKTLPAVR
ncbi:MAG: alpha/beta fold hydrolase [Acidobacteria bacterium]|nr:alpha/beta fold hydrolase [Acidobacteriota bacterium]